MINRYRRAESEEAARLAPTLVEHHIVHTKGMPAKVKTELAEIGRLVGILGGEEHLDRLVDLKDNLLTPSLDRLEKSLGGLPTGPMAPLSLNLGEIGLLKEALFGKGYRVDKMHQTILTGRGGLYVARGDLLHLRACLGIVNLLRKRCERPIFP